MSRIGKQPIAIPAGVDVTVNGADVKVKGKKGELSHTVAAPIAVAIEDGQILVSRPNDERLSCSLHGLTRTLIANMIVGVTEGSRTPFRSKLRKASSSPLSRRPSSRSTASTSNSLAKPQLASAS